MSVAAIIQLLPYTFRSIAIPSKYSNSKKLQVLKQVTLLPLLTSWGRIRLQSITTSYPNRKRIPWGQGAVISNVR
jgi:hypothetical protein